MIQPDKSPGLSFETSAVPQKDNNNKIGKTITIATIIMMGSVLLSRIAGLIREQVIALYGGTGMGTDAYVSAFLIPEMLNHFLAGGFLSVTFIPIFQKHILDGNRDKAWKTFSNLMSIGTLFFLILIPLSIVFTPQILKFLGIAADSKPQYFDTTVRLTRIILPAQLLFYWGAFFSAVQMAEKRFFIPAIAPLCYNLGIILGGLVLGPFMGIDGFAWGVLAGAVMANLLIQLPGACKLGLRFYPRFDFKDPDLILYIRKSIPLVLGLSMTFSNEIFFRYFAASLSDGVVSSVNYALRVMMMVVAMFGQASGAAFYPFLSKLALEKQFDTMNSMLNSVIKKVALFLIPICGIMIVLSEQVIAIIYQRGSFDYQSTLNTASILSVYLFGAFGFSVSMIISRSFYAMQNTLLPMIVSTVIVILSIPFYVLFSRHMGGAGIALAMVLSVTAQFIVLYGIWCAKYSRWKLTSELILSLIKISVVCVAGCAIAFLVKKYSMPICITSLFVKNMVVCTLATASSLLFIFVLYEFTGIQKFTDTVKGILRRR